MIIAMYVPYRIYLEAHLFKAGVYKWHGWKVNFRVESIITIKFEYGNKYGISELPRLDGTEYRNALDWNVSCMHHLDLETCTKYTLGLIRHVCVTSRSGGGAIE